MNGGAIYIVDSFTKEPFKDNPAGVLLSSGPIDDSRMQQIAFELKHSETAFVHWDSGDESYSIRFFSPQMEIPLCGHAALESAKVIFETTDLSSVCFATAGGLQLDAQRVGDQIEMQFPVYDLEPAAKALDDFDFYSRFFWPWSGGEEDPVTGATHTFLAKYWSRKLNKSLLQSFQASRRTGYMEIEVFGNEHILIRGDAVVILEGEFRV